MMLSIAHHYNEKTGQSFPSVKSSAQEVGCSERWAVELRKKLNESGDIFVIEEGRGRGNPSAFGLHPKYAEKMNSITSSFGREKDEHSCAKKDEHSCARKDEQSLKQNDAESIKANRKQVVVVVASPKVTPHNEKSPPSKTTTTTTIWEALMAELEQQYLGHNIGYEFERCREYNAKQGKKVTPTLFRKWMRRAELPLVRPKPKGKTLPPPPEPSPPPPPDDDPAALQKFLNDFELRKGRKLFKPEMKSKSQ